MEYLLHEYIIIIDVLEVISSSFGGKAMGHMDF